MKTCSVENCNNPIWGKGLCKYHTIQKPISKKSNYRKGTTKEDVDKMYEFFLYLWNKRKHISEVSGERIPTLSSGNFHHILTQSKYPQAKYDEDNIIFLSLQEHSMIHLNMYKYEEINKRREILKLKYNV